VKLGSQLERRLKSVVGWMRRTAAHDHPQQGLLFADDWQLTDDDAASRAATPSTQPPAPLNKAPEVPSTPDASSVPAHTPDELSQQQAFVHPAAQRRTRLHGHIVAYAFTRARRRSIGMAVGADGLSVRAPRWVTLTDVEAALQERASWIIKHLKDHQQLAARQQATRIVWRHGTTVPWLGEPLTILLDANVKGAQLDEAGEAALRGRHDTHHAFLDGQAKALEGLAPRVLRVGLPADATPQALRAAVHTWMQRQARTLFEARVCHYAAVLGVKVTRLSIGAARTRWGSAGADGSVRLNWRLMHHDMACIDYVVVHELSHLRHMNHSPAFWGVVKSVLPDYAQTKAKLSAKAHDLHD
jgi:predicted metal-dependent hydrolase